MQETATERWRFESIHVPKCFSFIYFTSMAVQCNLSIMDTLRPYFFACNIEVFLLIGKNLLRWTCWDQNSLSLSSEVSLESFKRDSTVLVTVVLANNTI